MRSKAPEKDLSEKTSGPLSWDRTDAMRCTQEVEETNEWMDGWKAEGEGLSRVQGGVAKVTKGGRHRPDEAANRGGETFA